MKILTMIVHAEVKQTLADTLRGLQQVQGFTFTQVEGHGAREGSDLTLTIRDDVVGYVPQVRVDIMLEERDLEGVLGALRNSQCGLTGRGSYWVTAVERQGRL